MLHYTLMRVRDAGQHKVSVVDTRIRDEDATGELLGRKGDCKWLTTRAAVLRWIESSSEEHSLTEQTTSKFPFRWWGVHTTLSGRHQLNGQPEPHSAEEKALYASESRD
jgi:hypothetical protein